VGSECEGGVEGVRGFTRRGRGNEATGVLGVYARARREPGRARRARALGGLCPWPWAELGREGKTREVGCGPTEMGSGGGAWHPAPAMHKEKKREG
jgi:hypothetical protein